MLGYREDGPEYMRNGMTGIKMAVPIFVGPTYYQNRLKHMVGIKNFFFLEVHKRY